VKLEYIPLQWWQVALAATLILINGLISILLRLRLERQLSIAAVRTVLQLLAIGYVLKYIFQWHQWYLVLLLTALMTVIAGMAAVRRPERRYPGILWDSIVSIWLSSWLIGAVALGGIVRVDPWTPQYAIPILGMLLGNALNGISLGLDRFGEDLDGKRDLVDMLLALGATRWEAARAPIQQAVRTGMVPIINAMMIVGIVSLPGMMTGQILSGVSPVQASLYQIFIMFLIAATASLGTVSVVLLGYRRLFSPDHQFLHRKLVRK
jgi:putative ABC transport system permease protein